MVMTKRTLYARLRSVLPLLPGSLVAFAVSLPAAAQPASCATCLVPVVTPGAAAALPEALNGFDVLVRVAAGREAESRPAIDAIARRGGRPGLLIEGLP